MSWLEKVIKLSPDEINPKIPIFREIHNEYPDKYTLDNRMFWFDLKNNVESEEQLRNICSKVYKKIRVGFVES